MLGKVGGGARHRGELKRLAVAAVALGLAACVGPAGPQGVQGLSGPSGEPGAAGQNGQDGATGATGAAGQNGQAGQDGANGQNATVTTTGLHVDLQSAAVANGVLTVTFELTDDNGTPLDRAGLATEGKVSMSWTVARLSVNADGSPGQYTNYVTRTETDPSDSTKTATQASTESNGTYAATDPANGVYTYTFATSVTPPDPTETHTVGVTATRPFQGKTYIANATFDFRPDGQPVTVQRQIVTEATCDSCHDRLEAHGGSRRETALCILCHTPQSADAETGNTIDFKVMIHKIHDGASLPSVENGVPYQIVGYRQMVKDFSTVKWPQPKLECTTCHQNKAQAGSSGSPTNAFSPDVWKTEPSMAACFSCHDNMVATANTSGSYDITFRWPTDFGKPASGACTADGDCKTALRAYATCDTTAGPLQGHCVMDTHPTKKTDASCATCHVGSDNTAPIETVHQDPMFDPTEPQLSLSIVGVTDTARGQTPVVTFQVEKNGAPYDIVANPLPRLAVNVAGPTTDYAQEWMDAIQGRGSTGTLVADPSGTPGQYQFTMAEPMPSTASGTYAFGLEGYLTATDGSTRLSAHEPIFFAPVTDETAVPRPDVVSTAKCEACHARVPGHGYIRIDPNYCVMCHNANLDNAAGIPHVQGATDEPALTLHFPELIHRIHRGDALTQPTVLGGYPPPSQSNPAGTALDLNEIRFPGDLRDCQTCHLAEPTLPLPEGRLPSLSEKYTCNDADPQSNTWCQDFASTEKIYTQPVTAACTACHDTPDAVAHAETMTAAFGTPDAAESCAVCHQDGSAFGIDVVHAREP